MCRLRFPNQLQQCKKCQSSKDTIRWRQIGFSLSDGKRICVRESLTLHQRVNAGLSSYCTACYSRCSREAVHLDD